MQSSRCDCGLRAVPVLHMRLSSAADERGDSSSIFAVGCDVESRPAVLQPSVRTRSICSAKQRVAHVIGGRHVESATVKNLQKQRDIGGCAGQGAQEGGNLGHGSESQWI